MTEKFSRFRERNDYYSRDRDVLLNHKNYPRDVVRRAAMRVMFRVHSTDKEQELAKDLL